MDKYAAAIDVEGMTCGSCVKTIESNVGAIPGVLSIQVELPNKEALVVLDPTVITINNILDKINSMGFVATQKSPKTSEGRLSPDSPIHGTAGHRADLASIFSGAGAGEGKQRPTARKPATGGVEGDSSQSEVIPSDEREPGQLAAKPEEPKQRKRALNTKPAHLCSPDLKPVAEKKITVVVYDVETSGSASTDEIIQLSANSAHGNFNTYIIPSGRISYQASQVHNITKVGGRLLRGKMQVAAKNKEEAWKDFIRFCENISPVLLVGHNVTFDARFTLNELEAVDLTGSFMEVVAGFSDTLPLLRGDFPQLDSHTQARIVSEVLGSDFKYESHNSAADVAALMEVIQKLNISDERLIEYSFTFSSFAQHMKNLKEEKIMEVLLSPRRVSKTTLRTLAMAEYTFKELNMLAQTKNQEDFMSTLLPVLPRKQALINLYDILRKFECFDE